MYVIAEPLPSPHNLPCQPLSTSNNFNFKYERNRLLTFENWPVNFIDKRELAANGLYYSNVDDIVICAFCYQELGNWVIGDIVKQEHARNCPDCPFVNNLNCGNVPWLDTDVCGKYHIPPPQKQKLEQSIPKTIFDPKSAVHPIYSSKTSRMATFRDWPISLKQKPEELAEAGFVYAGKGDKTFCHYCDIGLKDWEPEDTPWEEHERTNPECAFLKFNKPCTEKKRVERVVSKNAEKKKEDQDFSPEQENSGLCKVCFTNEANALFSPCCHLFACTSCASEMDKCAVCRCKLQGYTRAYIS